MIGPEIGPNNYCGERCRGKVTRMRCSPKSACRTIRSVQRWKYTFGVCNGLKLHLAANSGQVCGWLDFEHIMVSLIGNNLQKFRTKRIDYTIKCLL